MWNVGTGGVYRVGRGLVAACYPFPRLASQEARVAYEPLTLGPLTAAAGLLGLFRVLSPPSPAGGRGAAVGRGAEGR